MENIFKNYKKCWFNRYFVKMEYHSPPLGYRGDVERVPFYKYKCDEGIIIGECYKYVGVYVSERRYDGMENLENESAALVKRKRIDFYKVLLSYNSIVLVGKDDVSILD